MAVQIAMIGLGQIGTSIGLALAGQKELVRRIGHDRDFNVARQAEKLGAVDRVEINLPNAVSNADLILLALPVDQIRETVRLIAPDLKENAVILDTAPVKAALLGWMKELLPPDRHYIGLTPAINPAYLGEPASGTGSAHADLFQGGLVALITPPGVAADAIQLAADLVRLMGSTPVYMDPVELDSLMAATHLLPQFLATALLNVTVDQPGWREGRRLAGRAYAGVGGASRLDTPTALAEAALLASPGTLRTLDAAIALLQALRHDLETQDRDRLVERLENARQGYQAWQRQRQAGQWDKTISPVDTSVAHHWFGHLLGMNKGSKSPK